VAEGERGNLKITQGEVEIFCMTETKGNCSGNKNFRSGLVQGKKPLDFLTNGIILISK
jgi:hypothetical protein